jgi:probable RNA-binding protein EIF1AD
MPPPRRKLQATVEETLNPPVTLASTQQITRIIKAAGNNLYSVEAPSGKELLVELQGRFRSSIWLRRGGYVLVDTDRTVFGDRENKIDGEIVNVVREEKRWRKMRYWPAEFAKKQLEQTQSDEDESKVGRMPSSDEEDLETQETDEKVENTLT